MLKLIKKLLCNETRITKVTEDHDLCEIKGHLKNSLFSTRKLYKQRCEHEWDCVCTGCYVGDLRLLSDEQLLRGKV